MATETKDGPSTSRIFYKEIVGRVLTDASNADFPSGVEVDKPWNTDGFKVNEYVKDNLRKAMDDRPRSTGYKLVFNLLEDSKHLDPFWSRIGAAVKSGELKKGYIESMNIVSREDTSYLSLDFSRSFIF
ncbi:hypothetical protein LDC_1944 [sediment metagenome]|uniref:Uncharacterized protein n=1 Tax=sediment metagenome TaxID=749907 RepID=D9PK79_9ZZZZ